MRICLCLVQKHMILKIGKLIVTEESNFLIKLEHILSPYRLLFLILYALLGSFS